MFMENGTDIPGMERTACYTYDQRTVEAEGDVQVRCQWRTRVYK